MNEFSNEKLDLITDQAYNGFHEETIKQHWDNIIGFDQLQPDETVRLVVMPSPTSNLAKSFSSGTGMITDKEQIRSARDLIDRMTMLQGTEVPGRSGKQSSKTICCDSWWSEGFRQDQCHQCASG